MTDDKKLKKIPLLFFCTKSGKEPVRDWLLDLEEEDRHIVGFASYASSIWLAGWYAALSVFGKCAAT